MCLFTTRDKESVFFDEHTVSEKIISSTRKKTKTKMAGRLRIAALCAPRQEELRPNYPRLPPLQVAMRQELTQRVDYPVHLLHALQQQRNDYQNEEAEAEEQEMNCREPVVCTLVTGKKRSRRLSNSERGKLYRQRRKEYIDTLESSVDALRQEVEELQRYGKIQHDSLQVRQSPSSSSGAYVRTACEYISLFERGVPVVTSKNSSVPADIIFRSSRQAAFLNAMMTQDMVFGDNHGIQMLLEQWERYSMFHSSLRFHVKDVQIVESDATRLVSATASLRVRFSRLTIEKVFPHVLWNELLVQRLIGLEVEYDVGNFFYFNQDGKIERYDTEVDFVLALVNALGNIQDAMVLIGDAHIKEQALIGPDTEL